MNRLAISVKGMLTLFILSLALSCDDDNKIEETNWELVWEDNFEGISGASIDDVDWSFDMGTGISGWGNGELQYYTDRSENVSLDGNGNLAITAQEETFQGSTYTSGRITTKGKFQQAYGRFEASIKLPLGRGLWPAFWLLGSNIDQVDWPQCGEIDIMEYKGQEPTVLHGSMHGPGYSGLNGQYLTRIYRLPSGRFDTDFYLFAIEWDENSVNYYVDDFLYFRIEKDDPPGEWVFDQPFYILLNLAVGGRFPGAPDDQTLFPQTMLVDYVRVYKVAE